MHNQIIINGDPDMHVMHGLFRGHDAAKIAGKRIGLVVGQFGLNIVEPVRTQKSVNSDFALMSFFARNRRTKRSGAFAVIN